jgi:hypothetical protein
VILYALMNLMFGLVNIIVGLLPQGPAPAFIANVSPTIHNIILASAGLGAWIPWAVALSTAGLIFGIWLTLSGVSAVRYLLGWIPTMGGA